MVLWGIMGQTSSIDYHLYWLSDSMFLTIRPPSQKASCWEPHPRLSKGHHGSFSIGTSGKGKSLANFHNFSSYYKVYRHKNDLEAVQAQKHSNKKQETKQSRRSFAFPPGRETAVHSHIAGKNSGHCARRRPGPAVGVLWGSLGDKSTKNSVAFDRMM